MPAGGSRRKLPAPSARRGCSSTTGIPCFAATARAGEATPASTTSALGVQIAQVELEFLRVIAGIERRRGRAAAMATNADASSGPLPRTKATRSPRPMPMAFKSSMVRAARSRRPR